MLRMGKPGSLLPSFLVLKQRQLLDEKCTKLILYVIVILIQVSWQSINYYVTMGQIYTGI